VRPKLGAIEVSGCHLVPVIVQASSRGRQARGERPWPAWCDPASRSRPGSLPESHSGAPPRRASPGPHAADGRPAQYRDRAGVAGAGRWITWVRCDRSPAWS